jgi:hypothetical protein
MMNNYLDAKLIEKCLYAKNSDTFGIYVGFQEINGTIGPTKIGRTINVTALQRGRSQGGANWWFYAFWPLSSREETYTVEKAIKKELHLFKTLGAQNQQELYSLTPAQATKLIAKLLDKEPILRSTVGYYDSTRDI